MNYASPQLTPLPTHPCPDCGCLLYAGEAVPVDTGAGRAECCGDCAEQFDGRLEAYQTEQEES
jgi:hypothetical protein